MKKILFVALVACMCSLNVAAQSTKVIKGAVIDKNGNPLPGAMVEATGGAENTVVDADGTFSMEVPVWLKSVTVKYAGMKDQKLKVGYGDIIATMKPSVGTKWFLNLVASQVIATGGDIKASNWEYSFLNTTRLGLRGGFFRNWGMYLEGSVGFSEKIGVEASLGVIKHVWKPLYVYAGAGYSMMPYEYVYNSYYGYSEKREDYRDGMLMEFGVMCHIIKHLNASLGYGYTTEFDDAENHKLKLTVGYVF